MRENIIKELYSGGLSGHLEHDKTRYLIEKIYFSSSISRDVRKLVEGCKIC